MHAFSKKTRQNIRHWKTLDLLKSLSYEPSRLFYCNAQRQLRSSAAFSGGKGLGGLLPCVPFGPSQPFGALHRDTQDFRFLRCLPNKNKA